MRVTTCCTIALLALLTSVLCGAPLPKDVPRDHTAAEAVRNLLDCGILQQEDGGGFDGDRVVGRDDAAWTAARLIAYATLRLVSQDDETPLDDTIKDRVRAFEVPPEVPGVAVNDPGYFALAYLQISNPPDTPHPLAQCEKLTRYEMARVADEVLSRLIEAYESDLVGLVPPEDEETDYDFGEPKGPVDQDVEA